MAIRLDLGSSTSVFLSRFSNEHMYREISSEDINRARNTILNLGKPYQDTDKKAKEETEMILKFLEKYIDSDDVIIIIQDEF
jgi:hypothetical protein